jgi:hypothetical protein
MRKPLILGAVLVGLSVLGAGHAAATTNCSFTTVGTTMRLNADCTTDATIFIPNSMTLDGRWHTITAVDPPGDHFRGAILQNAAGATTVNIQYVTLTASGLSDPSPCHTGNDRLRGIALLDAGGRIHDVNIIGLKQSIPTVCAEGSGIIVLDAPFDGTHPATKSLVIEYVRVSGFQRTGIDVDGDILALIQYNKLEALAEPGIPPTGQFGILSQRGAIATVRFNSVEMDATTTNLNVTGIHLFEVDKTNVLGNRITGPPEGIFVDSVCAFASSANRNLIAGNVVQVTNEGVVLVARSIDGSMCDAHVDENLVSGNIIKAVSGALDADGIFVGAQRFNPAYTPVAHGNIIKYNVIAGFKTGVFQSGDTNTVIRGNVVIP